MGEPSRYYFVTHSLLFSSVAFVCQKNKEKLLCAQPIRTWAEQKSTKHPKKEEEKNRSLTSYQNAGDTARTGRCHSWNWSTAFLFLWKWVSGDSRVPEEERPLSLSKSLNWLYSSPLVAYTISNLVPLTLLFRPFRHSLVGMRLTFAIIFVFLYFFFQSINMCRCVSALFAEGRIMEIMACWVSIN